MSIPGLTGEDLLAWLNRTSAGWRNLVTQHPEALAIPCDIRETKNAGELLQHIVAVELRYAQRLSALPETPYEAVAFGSAEEIYATHDKAIALLDQLKQHDTAYWDEWIAFITRHGGELRVPRRIIFAHLITHSIRHYAQLATLVRQNGIAPNWPMDYLYMRPEEPQA